MMFSAGGFVGWTMKTSVPANVLVDPDEDLAVGETPQRDLAERLAQVRRHFFGQGPIPRPSKQQHLAARQREVCHVTARKPKPSKRFSSTARRGTRGCGGLSWDTATEERVENGEVWAFRHTCGSPAHSLKLEVGPLTHCLSTYFLITWCTSS